MKLEMRTDVSGLVLIRDATAQPLDRRAPFFLLELVTQKRVQMGHNIGLRIADSLSEYSIS